MPTVLLVSVKPLMDGAALMTAMPVWAPRTLTLFRLLPAVFSRWMAVPDCCTLYTVPSLMVRVPPLTLMVAVELDVAAEP